MSNWPVTLFRLGLLCLVLSLVAYPPQLVGLTRVSGVAFLMFSLISAAAELIEAESASGMSPATRV